MQSMHQSLGEPLLPGGLGDTHVRQLITGRVTFFRIAVAIALFVGAAIVATACALRLALFPASSLWRVPLLVATAPPHRVLLAGYSAWGNSTVNPAQLVAEDLDGICMDGVCFESWIVPVNTEGASRVASALLARADSLAAPWDAVIHIGLEASSKGLRIETAAANVKASESPAGAWSADVPCSKSGTSWSDIDSSAPCLLASTLPLDTIALDADAPTTPVELWSRDAGAFFCNEAFFRTLAVVRSQRVGPARVRRAGGSSAADTERDARTPTPLLPVTFIHLPTLETSPVSTSSGFVSHVGGLMVGRTLPSPSIEELIMATGGSPAPASTMGQPGIGSLAAATAPPATVCDAPEGRYTGESDFAGYKVTVTAVVSRDGSLRSGTMQLTVSGSMDLINFDCADERWRLQGDVILVEEDSCWRHNVEGNIDDLTMHYVASANAIDLHGTHLMWLVRVPLDLQMHAVTPCNRFRNATGRS